MFFFFKVYGQDNFYLPQKVLHNVFLLFILIILKSFYNQINKDYVKTSYYWESVMLDEGFIGYQASGLIVVLNSLNSIKLSVIK
jgi:hypothetical protein